MTIAVTNGSWRQLPCRSMVKVYAVALVAGVIALIIVLMGGALASNLGREGWDPGAGIGDAGKATIGALVGFGMGGISAEFSPLDLAWPVSLAIALGAAALSAFWVRYAVRQREA
jgi:hypothetical protein